MRRNSPLLSISDVFLRAASVLCLLALPLRAQAPLAQHVILVIEENHSFTDVFTNNGMPWLVGKGNQYAYSTNYFSDAGGSLLDYLWLASGSSESAFHCTGNDCYNPGTTTKDPITDSNIFQLMDSHPVTWKVYAQSYMNAGGNVNAPDSGRGTHYFARHVAAVWYGEILSNVLGASGEVVDMEQFVIDSSNGTLPRFSIIVPDGNYDAHDGSLGAADLFLQNNLTALLATSDFQAQGSGLLMVTFDECGGGTNSCPGPDGQVYTALIGPNVKTGYVSNVHYMHENTLRTMLDALNIHSYPGAAATAADMSDFFSSSAGGVAVDSPANLSTQGASVPVRAAANELGTSIHSMEVWDNGTKLAEIAATSINQSFTLGAGSHQMTIQDIGPGPSYAVLHKQVVNFTVVTTSGVTVVSPTPNSTQAQLLNVNAYAVESTGNVDHLEVWADGHKIGDSPKGATINQWYYKDPNLGVGSHNLSVEDVSPSGTVLHSQVIPIVVSSANNVYVNSPANNSTQGTSVLVNAYAYEQGSGSNQLIDHLEVWDLFNGTSTKLGNSPLGYATTSLFINQRYNLAPGAHQLVIQDSSTGTFQIIHKNTVNITVQ
jgi:hypothetical protein